MRTFSIIAGSSAFFLITPAAADNAGDAIAAFGLIGTWSVDCAKDGLVRDTFAASASGPPTMTSIVRRTGQVVTTVREIRSAVRESDDKIKYVMAVTKVTHQPEKDEANSIDPTPIEYLVQKFDSKIRVMDERSEGEKKPAVEDGIVTFLHIATPLKEKCAN